MNDKLGAASADNMLSFVLSLEAYALSQTSAGKERFAFGEQLRLRPLLSRVT